MYSPAPKSPELLDKNKKYDRQIRLWGDHGQNMLEKAQVCLVNVTALGTEILKGIVLPGIGGFTIVDGGVVTEEDIGCNYFQQASHLGLSRAKCCMELLQELNPDVNSDYIDESVESVLQNSPEFFKSFNAVVASSLREKTIIILSNILWDLNIPFFLCRSVGFVAIARLQIKEHCVIEAHPDNKPSDLRLTNPFSTLKAHFDSSELSSKIPWLVVIYKHLQQWRMKNDNRYPLTYKEKSQIRESIQLSMTNDEPNYEEAIRAVNSCFGGGKPSTELVEILQDPACNNLNKQSKIFWILAHAVRQFIENDGQGWLPVPGSIPDMTADTANYINLQNIYRAQANADADIVYRYAQQQLTELNLPIETITEQDTKLFCREIATICIVRGTKIADEYEKCHKSQYISAELEMPNTLMTHYVAFRTLDRFQSEHGCIPGECNDETDMAKMKSIASKLLHEWGISIPLSDDFAHEYCRYGGAEIHSVSAFMGGCVSHELIKLITKQYKPINNTFIYNAMTSETATFQM